MCSWRSAASATHAGTCSSAGVLAFICVGSARQALPSDEVQATTGGSGPVVKLNGLRMWPGNLVPKRGQRDHAASRRAPNQGIWMLLTDRTCNDAGSLVTGGIFLLRLSA